MIILLALACCITLRATSFIHVTYERTVRCVLCVCCRCRFVKMISSGTAGVAVSGSSIRGVCGEKNIVVFSCFCMDLQGLTEGYNSQVV